GMFIGAHVPFLHMYYYQMMAVVTGILLHVSSVMLFDCDMAMYGKLKKLAVIVAGLLGAMLLTC
ncbi:MAG: ZIP family metal transporter, partial [Flavobacteriales bacterium]|nr:ZIP family metal transporter [Flavobacteriales bacterium]